MKFSSTGILTYGPGIKAAVLIDPELARYYFNAIPNYYYLESWSDMIGDLREKLGLTRYRVGFDSYHITIGNNKN